MKLGVVLHRPGATSSNVARALRSLSSKDVVPVALPDEVFMTSNILDGSSHMTTVLRELGDGEIPVGILDSRPDFIDESSSYDDVLPGPFSGRRLPETLSTLVNRSIERAEVDYLLVMSPTETCSDPENIVRTLAFLESRVAIDVVCCPIHIYDSGEHVATTMEPKIFRVAGAARAAGPLADRHEPSTEHNHLLAASGFDFQEHDYYTRTDVDLKLRLRTYQTMRKMGMPADKVERRLVIDLARELLRCKPAAAIEMMRPIVDSLTGGRADEQTGRRPPPPPIAAAPLATLGRAWDMVGETIEAHRCFTLSVDALPTPDGLLGRGLHRHRNHLQDWKRDLEEALKAAREVTTYGLDLRELRQAARLLAGEGTRGR